jgi:hypothetical protein
MNKTVNEAVKDFEISKRKWAKLEDDSHVLKESIDDCVNGWIEELYDRRLH